MKETQLSYWNFYPDLENAGGDHGKGWITQNGEEDPFIVAHLHLIANMARDRSEMHSMIAQQRDNWNKLFQSSLIAITMAATILSALSGYSLVISFSLPACTMDVFVAFIMIGFNKFQPSQLAEEQRTAARLCRKLAHDIEFMLKIAPQLRQDAQSYVDEAVGRLYAVDKAYPLPLTPMVVEKFPKEVTAPVLSKHGGGADFGEGAEMVESGNGWEGGMVQNLVEVGELMVKGDARVYKERAERVQKMNKVCAVGGPISAGMGAALNMVGVLKGIGVIRGFGINVGVMAAMANAVAAFLASFSHDAQLGMIFELFRSTMGYFEELQATIKRALRLPVSKRENGVLFKLRVAYELGRKPEDLPSLLSSHKTAGALF